MREVRCSVCRRFVNGINVREFASFIEPEVEGEIAICDDCWRDNLSQTSDCVLLAAHELLDACKAYLDAMERYGHPDKTDRLMRIAIDKAEGRVL